MAQPGRILLRAVTDNPYVLLTLTALVWAGNAVAGRLAVGEVSPMALTALRWIMVVGLLALFARRQIAAEWRALVAHWPFLLLMGGLGYTSFNALFYAAAYHTSAVNLGIIQGTMPALVILGGFLAYRTPIRGLQLVGVACTLAGVALVASRGDITVLTGLAFNIGDVWMMLASILYAGYTVALRRRPPVSGLAFFAGLAAAAFLTSLPLLAYEAATHSLQWPTAKGWAILAFIAILPSFLSQILFLRGVDLIGPARAGLFINLVPVFAAMLAVAILGEHFGAYHAVALLLVLGGIWIAERGRG